MSHDRFTSSHSFSAPRALALVLCLVAPLAACGDDGSTESTETTPDASVAGTFNGQFIVQNTTPPVGGTMTFSVGADGTFTGSTSSTNPETMGEKGTLEGNLTGSDPLSLDLDVTLSTPSGTFRLTGKCVYDDGSGTLNGSAITAKDEGGTFVGNAPFTATQE